MNISFVLRAFRFGAIAALVALLSIPSISSAQEQLRMKVQPTLIEEKVDPGVTLTKTVYVSNLSLVTQTLYPTTKDIVGIGPDGRPIYSTEERDLEGMSVSSWVTFAEKSIDVPPNSTKEVHLTITVPKEAGPGTHFGGIFLAYQPSGVAQNATGVGYEIGTILNLQISGEVVTKAIIREFSTDKIVYGEPNVNFTTRVENLGNVFIRPRGLIEIHNMFGKKVDTPLSVNEAVAGILPAGTRSFETNWAPNNFQIGKYTALITLGYGDPGAQQSISTNLEFWVLPIKLLLPIFIALLVLVLAIYITLRLYVRRQLARLGRVSGMRRENVQGLSRLAAVIIAILIAVIVGLLILFFYFG